MGKYLITGGCGFVGSNLTTALLNDGHTVVAYDNLARSGAERNLAWLQSRNDANFQFVRGDIRDMDSLQKTVNAGPYDAVYHIAGQVAVTTSVVNPREDYEVNATGTFNTLEAVRLAGLQCPFFFTSTNKVYGGMEHAEVVERDGRYDYAALPHGASEEEPLDFHSPYGCSKGTADQYVRDYARIYGIPTVVFRMSCQYGPRQFGNEDQGWVAHFVIAASKGQPINIFGDGKQVRDVLYIDDLVAAFRAAERRIDATQGRIYNIGGGPANVISLIELVSLLEQLTGRTIPLEYGDWRPGDQRVYISDIRRAEREFGWKPAVSKTDGVSRLYRWVQDNPTLFGG